MQQSYNEIWASVLEKLKNETAKSVYDLWFADTELLFLDDEKALVCIQSDLKRDILSKRYMPIVHNAISEIIGFDIEVTFLSSEKGTPDISAYTGEMSSGEKSNIQNPNYHPASLKREPSAIYSNADFTFENFIVGSSNRYPYAACMAVAEHPAVEYNPLFIYGPSGLGKTHLLYAIMNKVANKYPDMKIIYIRGEEFTNELIESIAKKSQTQFRNKYRNADLLLIDDIQFIAGKESIQEEFFNTFNALYEDHRQIVLVADRPPRDMKTLEDRLKTRFEWGLLADIQPPDFELRSAILKNKAKMIGVNIPYDVLNFLAENLRSNIRQLEGAIKRISAHSFLNGVPITREMAQVCIADMITADESPQMTVENVISKVCKKYGLSEDDIKGRKKTKEIAMARHICIYIIRKLTDLSLPAIGRILNRDHTTVMSSLQVIENELRTNPLLDIEINDIMREIRE